jgi:hypothetical protein
VALAFEREETTPEFESQIRHLNEEKYLIFWSERSTVKQYYKRICWVFEATGNPIKP